MHIAHSIQTHSKPANPCKLILILALTMLTACGGSSDDDNTSSTTDNTSSESVTRISTRPSNTSCLAPDSADEVAAMLSETGCWQDVAQHQLIEGVVPYTVNNILWTDSEKKGRYFALPDSRNISLNSEGGFIFPDGAVVIKDFIRDGVIVETRLLMKHAIDGWGAYSYQWEDENDARLLTSSAQLHNHYYPSQEECMECHTEQVDITIGNETLQQNYSLQYTSGETENYLDMLSRLGYLAEQVPSTLKDQRLYAIDDTSATLEQRARSYLHSNCMGCHRPGAPGGGVTLLYSANLLQMGCNVDANDDSIGISNPKIIEPGSAIRSALYRRISTTASYKMPPIGRETVDSEALAVIGEWIDSLTDGDCGS